MYGKIFRLKKMTTKINIPSPCDGLIDYNKRIEETSPDIYNNKTRMNEIGRRCFNQSVYTNHIGDLCQSCFDKLTGKVENDPNKFDYVTVMIGLPSLSVKENFIEEIIINIMGKIK